MNVPATVSALKPLPGALMGYQQNWVAQSADVALWEKSRRVGASWCDAADSVLFASSEGGQDAMYIGYSEDMTREYIDDCAMWARAFSVAAGEMQEVMFDDIQADGTTKGIKAFRIDFANGQKILALSSRPRSIRGKQGKITIDEAAFHDDLPGLLKAALAMLIWGGKVYVISSHNGEANYFNELVLNVRAGRLPYKLHRTTFEDAVNDGLYRRVCLRKGIEWTAEGEKEWVAAIFARYKGNSDEELMCIPSQGTGIWLPRSLIEARMRSEYKVLRYTAPKGMALWTESATDAAVLDWCQEKLQPEIDKLDRSLRSTVGVDFGRHIDLSCFAPLQVEKLMRKRFPFLVELGNTPYRAQRGIFFYLCDRLPRFSAAKLDSGGNGDYLAEEAQRKYGEARVEKVKFSEMWYRENTAPFKADFEDDLMLIPKDDDVGGDLAAFRMIKGVPRVPDLRVTMEDGQKRHGDAGIAMLLAHAGAKTNFVPMEFQSVGVPRDGYSLGGFFGG